MNLRNRRVTVLGLGRHGGGVAAARYCAEAGAIVTVTDLADRESLAESLAALQDAAISTFILDEHREEDFRSAEVVVVNPAVRPGNPFVEIARRAGATINSEIELFLRECPATVIGVTGTVGKSTTAAMVAAIFQAGGRQTWLGGNIGHSLLADLPNIRSDHLVVLELSSFQLHWLSDQARWPHAAIMTNCSPNHLDWHGSWGHYVAAKRRLIDHLPPCGISVLGDSLHGDPMIEQLPPLRIPGQHNRHNAACAAAMARAFGIKDDAISQALAEFHGLPHRLQFVAKIDGRAFYNDSKSTTPAATIAALATMDRPIWILLGGADNQSEHSALLTAVIERTQGAAIFGSVATKLEKQLHVLSPHFQYTQTSTLADALNWCWARSQPGDAILLSSAFPSTDQFRDFTHRGEEFQRLVNGLPRK